MIRRVVAFTGTASPRPTPGHCRVDAHDVRAGVGQGAAGVAGVEGGVGLDDVLDEAGGGPLRVGSERPRALTTPAVTDPASPSGLPTATTSWPTTRSSASPSVGGRGVTPSARSTARSDRGSAPTRVNGALVPSENSAVP